MILRSGSILYLIASVVVFLRVPGWAPAWAGFTLLAATWPLVRAWWAARGTALRPAIAWALVAVGLGLIAQIVGNGESFESGRPVAGHWAYLSTISTLAALISVLNARRPGGGAWAILMGMLVVIFLIPWLESTGLTRGAGGWDRLRLESPWTLFFLLLTVAGVTNFLPTRFGAASACAGLALGMAYLGLTRVDWPRAWRGACWSAGPWSLAVAIWAAEIRSRASDRSPPGPDRLWLWFRDRWGVVWALRVQERFQKTAEANRWPCRLTWFGLVAVGDETTEVLEAVEATLKSLLRRFADPSRLEEVAGRGPGAGLVLPTARADHGGRNSQLAAGDRQA